MAKIKIIKDTFGIAERIKKLDKNYYIVYDTSKKQYEVHNSRQIQNTFCVTVGRILDVRALIKLHRSSVSNMDYIIKHIEEHNEKLEAENKRKREDMVSWRAREIYRYAISKGGNFDDAYSTKWV